MATEESTTGRWTTMVLDVIHQKDGYYVSRSDRKMINRKKENYGTREFTRGIWTAMEPEETTTC